MKTGIIKCEICGFFVQYSYNPDSSIVDRWEAKKPAHNAFKEHCHDHHADLPPSARERLCQCGATDILDSWKQAAGWVPPPDDAHIQLPLPLFV